MSNNSNEPSPPKNQHWLWTETAKTIVLSVIFAFGIRTVAAQAFNVLSGSMEPTLQIDDRFLVDKITYRFYDPKRGDIIVFSPTEELAKEHYNDAFIKRIIALPGEKVEIKDGKVYINNQPLAEDKYISPKHKTSLDVCSASPQSAYLSKPVTIPPSSYLVLGDNRKRSYDSRCWGVVHRRNIIGRAVLRFWPLNNFGGFDK